jgi:hypothetical protein
MTEEQRKAIFTIDLGANGGVYKPATLDDFVSWLESERQKWQWLERGLDERVPANILDHVFGKLDAVVNYARSIRDNNSLDVNDPPSVLYQVSLIRTHLPIDVDQ